VTSSWFFLSTLNYDARSTTHQESVISWRLGVKSYALSPLIVKGTTGVDSLGR